jgi:1-deoxy-D-xylulose-5-phosphate reductoisomerase
MKKKIAILGSTGSIGKSTLDLIKKDKTNFEVVLLTSHKNVKELDKQAKIFNVKNLIITDYKSFISLKRKYKKKR